MTNTSSDRQFHLVAPLLLVAGLFLAAIPVFHPNNTCHDWLEKWGQLSSHPLWIPIHQVSVAGYALGAAAALAIPFLGPRTRLGFLGGGSLGAGLGIMTMVGLIHATAVSAYGEAFNASSSEEARRSLRLSAEAWVRYDVGYSLVAAALLSAGAALLSWHLYRCGALSRPAGIFFVLLGLVWGLQAHGIFQRLHLPSSEWVPFAALGGWLGGLGLLLTVRSRPG